MKYNSLIILSVLLICAGCASSGHSPVTTDFENCRKLNKYLKSGIKYYKDDNPVRARQEFVKFFAALEIDCRIEFENITNEEAYKEHVVKEYIDRFEPILIDKSQNIQVQLMKGIAFFNNGNYKSALEYFVKVLVSDNRNKEALEYVKMANQEMARLEEEQEKRELLKEHEEAEKRITEYYSQAEKYFSNGFFIDAKLELDKVMSIDPDYMKTREYYSKVNAELLKVARKHYEDGLELYSSGDIEKAIQLWEKAARLAPEYKEAQKALERAKARFKK